MPIQRRCFASLIAVCLGMFGDLLTVAAEERVASEAVKAATLPRATPESQGIPSRAIRKFVEAADKQIESMHSFMLVRHGHVVAEGWWAPESADKPHIQIPRSGGCPRTFTSFLKF